MLRAFTRKKIISLNLIVLEIWGMIDHPHWIYISTPPCMSVAINKSEIFFILMIALDKRNILRYIWRYMHLWWCSLKFRLSNLQYFACIQLFYIFFNKSTIYDGIKLKLGIFVIYISYNMILKIHTDFSDRFLDINDNVKIWSACKILQIV